LCPSAERSPLRDIGSEPRCGFRLLDVIGHTEGVVATIDEIPGFGAHARGSPLWAGRIGLVNSTSGSLARATARGKTVLSAALAGVAATAWISLLRLSTPKCPFILKYRWLPFLV
jgi:hypothetical protein